MISAHSRRGQRMQKRSVRGRKVGSMNLVSLMDIFTILVFFLLVQSSAVEVLPSTDALALPESNAEERARETVLVMVTPDDILVNGKRVMATSAALEADSSDLPALSLALQDQAKKIIPDADPDAEEDRGEVTVMADKALPYALITRIMRSCVSANYGKVSFAVLSREQSTVQLSSS